MTPRERREQERRDLDRRRRARNWAMLALLTALVVLFYFMTMARLSHGLP